MIVPRQRFRSGALLVLNLVSILPNCLMHTRELIEPTQQEIAENAYSRWLAEGSPEGQEAEHWFAAETQLMQREMLADGIAWTRQTTDLPQALDHSA